MRPPLALCGCLLFTIAATGLLGSLGLLSDTDPLAPGTSTFIIMAPATATLFLLCSLALVARARWPGRRETLLALAAIGAAAALLGLSILVHVALDLSHVVTRWRMAPLAAGNFVFDGAALMLLALSRSGRPRLGDVAGVLASCSALVTLTILLGYAYDTPAPGDSTPIPMALLTSLGFLTLDASIILFGGPTHLPLRPFTGDATRAQLLRTFVPTVAAAVVFNGLVHSAVVRQMTSLNATLLNASATAFVVVVTAVMTTHLARLIGARLDAAERGRTVAEREASRTERMFHSFMEHGPFTAFIRNASGQYLYANPFFAQMYASTPASILNKTNIEIGFPEALAVEVAADDQKVLRTGAPTSRTVEMRHFDGEMRQWLAVKFPLIDATGATVVGGVAIDMSARVQAEEAKRVAQEQLQKSYKLAALGEMAGNIAHEINNPLAIIDGKSQQLADLLKSQPPDVERAIRFAGTISSMALRLVKIVNGLRTMSRESTRDPFTRHSLTELVDEAVALCLPKFHLGSIALSAETSGLPHEIECRPSEVTQVLLNVLGNAFDAVEPLEERWVKVLVQDEQEHVIITVTDSGLGIPIGVRDHILDPFFTTKSEGKGTGLGLSISTQLVHRHGGSLTLDTAAPRTCFVIKLPKKQSANLA